MALEKIKHVEVASCGIETTVSGAKTRTELKREPVNTAWGKHGMLIFGGEKYLYASHLPMFHAPHDYQVIFRFHVRDNSQHERLMRAVREQSMVWTIDPIEFDLTRLDPRSSMPLREFQADVYQGHFERDGRLLYRSQDLVVDEVLVFRQLREHREMKIDRYFLFTDGGRSYAMKRIDGRPDIDVLLQFSLQEHRSQSLPCSISLPAQKRQVPNQTQWQQGLRSVGVRSEGALRMLTRIYVETGDLE